MIRNPRRLSCLIEPTDLSEPVNALATALEVVRLACKGKPDALKALDRADRQLKILIALAEQRDRDE